MRALDFTLAAMLAASLCACTVGPDFKPPRANAPGDWNAMQRSAGAEPRQAQQPAPASTPTVESDPDPRWWRSFGDPTLDALIERALSGNPDLQIAVVRIAQAREQTRQAVAQGLPNVRASANSGRAAPHFASKLASGAALLSSLTSARSPAAMPTDGRRRASRSMRADRRRRDNPTPLRR